jgi:hypothetical protein
MPVFGSPEKLKEGKEFVPLDAKTVPLNVAFPADDISSVRAVISTPPSLPKKRISLSDTSRFHFEITT